MNSTIRELDIDVITRSHLEKGLISLGDEFAGIFSAATIERYMVQSLEGLPSARVKTFVPLFVHG